MGRPPKDDGEVTVFGMYLIESNITHQETADALGISRVTVSMLARGLRYPSADLMWEIECWSKSKVAMSSWYEAED